jgi:hypothetical protein
MQLMNQKLSNSMRLEISADILLSGKIVQLKVINLIDSFLAFN